MSASLYFALAGVGLAALGLRGVILNSAALRKLIAVNVMGVGVFLILIATAYGQETPDPVPHALVLTGIVVAVSATALGLALLRRLLTGDEDER